LGSAAKDVAQTGAAIGRDFEYELLASITDLAEPQLGEALDRLTNSSLLFVRGMPPQSSYLYKHALVLEAAYGTLLRSRRQRLHGRIASALEDRFPSSFWCNRRYWPSTARQPGSRNRRSVTG
jgi:predicted ATPase